VHRGPDIDRISIQRSALVTEKKKAPGKLMALLAFLPWLVYIFGSGSNHWAVATAGGAIVCLGYLAILRRQTTIKLMDWMTLAYFVTASILMIGLHSTALPVYQVMIIWAFYAVAGWASIAVGKPFTAAYAREEQPPEVWDLPIFHRLNRIMTLFWCGLFSVNVGLGAMAVMVGGNLGKLVPGFLIPMGLLIYGFAFSKRFPMRYVARVNAAGAAAEAAESTSNA
jgi:hypothetical protein